MLVGPPIVLALIVFLIARSLQFGQGAGDWLTFLAFVGGDRRRSSAPVADRAHHIRGMADNPSLIAIERRPIAPSAASSPPAGMPQLARPQRPRSRAARRTGYCARWGIRGIRGHVVLVDDLEAPPHQLAADASALVSAINAEPRQVPFAKVGWAPPICSSTARQSACSPVAPHQGNGCPRKRLGMNGPGPTGGRQDRSRPYGVAWIPLRKPPAHE